MRWRHWFGLGRTAPGQRDRDVDREIRAHLDLEAEERQDTGMTAEEARDAARRAFGNRTLVREDVRAIWGTPWLDALLQDVRYAARTMRRSPGFAAAAVGSSALGIGACATIFAILNFAMLQRLPVDEPAGLFSVSETNLRTGEAGDQLSYPDLLDLRRARSFESVAGYMPLLSASIGVQGDPQRHWGALVTANYFAVVRPRFAAGRGFDPGRDDTRDQARVVVLSHQLWQTRFGGDPGIVGRSVTVNTRPATVIGVTGAGFRGTEVGFVSDFWIPFSMIDELESRTGRVTENRQRYWLGAVARLRPGAGIQEARAELDVMASGLNAMPAARERSRGFHVEKAGQINPGLRRVALTLFSLLLCATVLVLLTACANVANLLLGRASARRREIAARMALGASRGRLLRQLLTESLMLALLGGVGGWLIAAYGAKTIGLLRIPLGWPLELSIPLDYHVLLFCAGLSIVTGVTFGLVPALRATRPDLLTDLKTGERGAAGGPAVRPPQRSRGGADRDLHRAAALHGAVPAQPAGGPRDRLRPEKPESPAAGIRSQPGPAFGSAGAAAAARHPRAGSHPSRRRVRHAHDQRPADLHHEQLELHASRSRPQIPRDRASAPTSTASAPGSSRRWASHSRRAMISMSTGRVRSRSRSSTTRSRARRFPASPRSAGRSLETACRCRSRAWSRRRNRGRLAKTRVHRSTCRF